MGKYFGTDGIRGIVNETLDCTLAYKTGAATGTVLCRMGIAAPRAIIGTDTRISCDMLKSAITAGLCATGVEVMDIGVMPTPGIAYTAVQLKADIGVVISASHNPYEHNGIKVFGADGYKLSDALEDEIECIIDNPEQISVKHGRQIGRKTEAPADVTESYIEYLASHGVSYNGRVIIDCANGAAVRTAERLFRRLCPNLVIVGDTPNGVNINENCGSMSIGSLSEKVKTQGFDIGFAFDGDADRCLAADETGATIDGDVMLAIFAESMQRHGSLRGNGMVGTIVSNSGMDRFAQERGFEFIRASVGDRNVLEVMRERGFNLGGESSGHMIFSDDATTGDGQLSAVKFLKILSQSGKKPSRLCACVKKIPQVMPGLKISGGVGEMTRILEDPRLKSAVQDLDSKLKPHGRVLIRASGTEPLIRVLVESESRQTAFENAEMLIELMKKL